MELNILLEPVLRTATRSYLSFPIDLSTVSSRDLNALSDALYHELDTVRPDPQARDRYDDLVEELNCRACLSAAGGHHVSGS